MPPPKLSTWPEVIKVLLDGVESALQQKQTAKQALHEAACPAEPLVKNG